MEMTAQGALNIVLAVTREATLKAADYEQCQRALQVIADRMNIANRFEVAAKAAGLPTVPPELGPDGLPAVAEPAAPAPAAAPDALASAQALLAQLQAQTAALQAQADALATAPVATSNGPVTPTAPRPPKAPRAPSP